jgi:glycosyltransferase involved in cell wall biosynthesis
VDLWLTKAGVDLSHIEVIITVDGDDQESLSSAIEVAGAHVNTSGAHVDVHTQYKMPFDCVKGWNLAAAKSKGHVIIAIADDFYPPENWAVKLLEAGPQGWVLGEYAVHINDGFVQNLMTLPIITRKRYDRFGYLYHPAYKSMYVDTDLTYRAYLDDVVINASHLLFEHQHCDNGKRVKDGLDLEHASSDRYHEGQAIFDYRSRRGFPIDVGPRYDKVNAAKNLPVQDKFCAYIQAIKDDFCLDEVSRRLYDEGVRSFFYCIPSHYWNGNKTPSGDIKQVKDIANKLAALEGVAVYVRVFDVAKHFAPNRTRIQVETRVRNEALDWMYDTGWYHYLIVDSDELWRIGLLNKLNQVLTRATQVNSAVAGMVPAVGLPGYPVNDAKDTVTLYINACDRFRECRAPLGAQVRLDGHDVIHFTGVRRTMQEIVAKHRDSGHYDDPTYDFEGWLRDVLPNIRPGLQNVHMYRNYQIWPSIRNWTENEVADIPHSLHTFLGLDSVLQDLPSSYEQQQQQQPERVRKPESAFVDHEKVPTPTAANVPREQRFTTKK